MKVSRFLANQYANPTGWFGRHVTSHLLSRANKNLNAAVFNALLIAKNDRFLEIGFGGGDLLLSVSRTELCSEICGIEKSESMLDKAATRLNSLSDSSTCKLKTGDIENLPLESNQFDKVCSVNTLYFWKDLHCVAAEVARVTTPNGKVILGFSLGETLKQSGYQEHGFQFYDLEQVHQAMFEADLHLVHVHQLERKNKDSFFIPVYCKQNQ